MNIRIEFISEKKVVATLDNIEEAINFSKELQKARVLSQESLSAIWFNVGKLLEVDPFLPLSLRIINPETNKIIAKKEIWGNTVC
mgnify:CR=1 FL=1